MYTCSRRPRVPGGLIITPLHLRRLPREPGYPCRLNVRIFGRRWESSPRHAHLDAGDVLAARLVDNETMSFATMSFAPPHFQKYAAAESYPQIPVVFLSCGGNKRTWRAWHAAQASGACSWSSCSETKTWGTNPDEETEAARLTGALCTDLAIATVRPRRA